MKASLFLKGLDLRNWCGRNARNNGAEWLREKHPGGQYLTGRDEYEVTEGSVQFMGKDLLDLEARRTCATGLVFGFSVSGGNSWRIEYVLHESGG